MFKAGQVGRASGNEGIRSISGLARYVDLGPARHWEILVSVWSRYQKIQMIDRDGGLCAIADRLAGYERSDVTIKMVVTEDRVRRIDRHIFVETIILDELRAGCFELKTMIDSDIGGSFRFGSTEPLLSTQDDRIVRCEYEAWWPRCSEWELPLRDEMAKRQRASIPDLRRCSRNSLLTSLQPPCSMRWSPG